MRRLVSQALAEPGTQWFLLALAVLCLCWPLVSLLAEGSWTAVLLRFFSAWGLLLGILVLLALAAARRDTPR